MQISEFIVKNTLYMAALRKSCKLGLNPIYDHHIKSQHNLGIEKLLNLRSTIFNTCTVLCGLTVCRGILKGNYFMIEPIWDISLEETNNLA
ncbi:MAG: hypothetical protein O4859_22160 [Trichodesmium sp. St18_bin1]|nr:hypothetical protein [Trichodesmium sp. St18_bin1]